MAQTDLYVAWITPIEHRIVPLVVSSYTEELRRLNTKVEQATKDCWVSWAVNLGGSSVLIQGAEGIVKIPARGLAQVAKQRKAFEDILGEPLNAVGVGPTLDKAIRARDLARRQGRKTPMFYSPEVDAELQKLSSTEEPTPLSKALAANTGAGAGFGHFGGGRGNTHAGFAGFSRTSGVAAPAAPTPESSRDHSQGEAAAAQASDTSETPPAPEMTHASEGLISSLHELANAQETSDHSDEAKAQEGKDALRQKIAKTLDQVRQQAPILGQLKTASPSTYATIQALIQGVIDMARALGPSAPMAKSEVKDTCDFTAKTTQERCKNPRSRKVSSRYLCHHHADLAAKEDKRDDKLTKGEDVQAGPARPTPAPDATAAAQTVVDHIQDLKTGSDVTMQENEDGTRHPGVVKQVYYGVDGNASFLEVECAGKMHYMAKKYSREHPAMSWVELKVDGHNLASVVKGAQKMTDATRLQSQKLAHDRSALWVSALMPTPDDSASPPREEDVPFGTMVMIPRPFSEAGVTPEDNDGATAEEPEESSEEPSEESEDSAEESSSEEGLEPEEEEEEEEESVDVMDGVSLDEAFSLAQDLDVDLETISLEEWRKGIAHEREHSDVTTDATTIAKIALSHLKENPKYYSDLESKMPLEKALGDMPVGKDLGGSTYPVPGAFTGSHDYTHALKPEHQQAGYSMQVHHDNSPGTQQLAVTLHHGGNMIGSVNADVFPTNKNMSIDTAELHADHRSKGVGMAMYEGLLAHAKNHLGVRSVVGGDHSTMASTVHTRLAQKHGMDYKAQPNPGMAAKPSGPSDGKVGPYSYAIKAELPMKKSDPEQYHLRQDGDPYSIEEGQSVTLRNENAMWDHGLHMWSADAHAFAPGTITRVHHDPRAGVYAVHARHEGTGEEDLYLRLHNFAGGPTTWSRVGFQPWQISDRGVRKAADADLPALASYSNAHKDKNLDMVSHISSELRNRGEAMSFFVNDRKETPSLSSATLFHQPHTPTDSEHPAVSVAKAELPAAKKAPTKHPLVLPPGSIHEGGPGGNPKNVGKVKIKHGDGSTSWIQARSGMVTAVADRQSQPLLGQASHPLSSRNPAGH
jgi:hypothetical protein